MTITAKVRCYSAATARITLDAEQDSVTFQADYVAPDGSDINKAWARYTPALSINMTVRREVPFEPGMSYTLTFEPEQHGEDQDGAEVSQ